MMLSKEDMALEALIKVITEISWDDQSISDQTLNYAKQALIANGWEVYLDEFTRAHIRKLDDKATN
jgi:hypothetical protein